MQWVFSVLSRDLLYQCLQLSRSWYPLISSTPSHTPSLSTRFLYSSFNYFRKKNHLINCTWYVQVIIYDRFYPAVNYMFKVISTDTGTRCEMCSKLTIKTWEKLKWGRSCVFIVNSKHISHFVLVFFFFFVNIEEVNAGWVIIIWVKLTLSYIML